MQAFNTVLDKFERLIIGPVMQVVFAAGFLLFLWGLVQFLWNLEESSSHEEGKQHMLWGIIGMFIMVSIWGIIGMISNTFNLGVNSGGFNDGTGNLPGVTGNLFE